MPALPLHWHSYNQSLLHPSSRCCRVINLLLIRKVCRCLYVLLPNIALALEADCCMCPLALLSGQKASSASFGNHTSLLLLLPLTSLLLLLSPFCYNMSMSNTHHSLLHLQVASNSDVIFVAVKPQYVGTVLSEVRPVLQPDTVVISIAAGITIDKLLEAAGPDARVVRVMPNTPCLVGETAAAMCLGGQVSIQYGP